jgi:hypothetical protein
MALEKVTFYHKKDKTKTKTLTTAHAVAFIKQMELMKKVDFVLQDGYTFDSKDILKVSSKKEKQD